MTQVEALRLAMQKTPLEKLKPVDVLTHGFYQIKNFDTGGVTNTPLNYGPGTSKESTRCAWTRSKARSRLSWGLGRFVIFINYRFCPGAGPWPRIERGTSNG